MLNTAPYIEIGEITLNDGETGIKVEYLHTVAARIRAGLPPEIIVEQPAPIDEDQPGNPDDSIGMGFNK